jgi:hypothetical protein
MVGRFASTNISITASATASAQRRIRSMSSSHNSIASSPSSSRHSSIEISSFVHAHELAMTARRVYAAGHGRRTHLRARQHQGADGEPQSANAAEGLRDCERQAFQVLARCREQGESAKTADRTERQKLLQFCRNTKGAVQFVVVFNLTRFARDKYNHFALRAHL